MFDAQHHDVYVTAPGAQAVREASLVRLIQIHPLDAQLEQAFLRGERVLLRARVSEGEASRIATGLRALGVTVEIQAVRAAMALAELDDLAQPEAPRAAAHAPEPNLLFDVGAGLVGLDGEDEPAEAPRRFEAPAARGDDPLLGGLSAGALADLDAGPTRGLSPQAAPPRGAPPPPRAAPPPPPRAAPPPRPAAAAPAAEDLFRPSGPDTAGIQLELDQAPLDPMLSVRKTERETFEAPRCTTHRIAKVDGVCPRCASAEATVKGRFFGGRLRGNPALRAGVGMGAGLLIGWIATAPLARRAERQVEFIREEAQRERARPTEEAQAHAKALDAQADDEANAAFLRTLGAWAIITAVTALAWHRLT